MTHYNNSSVLLQQNNSRGVPSAKDSWSCFGVATTSRRRNMRLADVSTANTTLLRRCPCGAQFCYICGQKWHTCSCPQWDENRLYDRALQITERNPRWRLFAPPRQEHEQPLTRPASPLSAVVIRRDDTGDDVKSSSRHISSNNEENSGVPTRSRRASDQLELIGNDHQRLAETMQYLREYHVCTYQKWRYVSGPHACEECMHYLPDYIFECRQCALQACNRCRRNRL
jgi:hypothetical protein